MRLSLLQENQLQENYPRQRNEQNKKKNWDGTFKEKNLQVISTELFNYRSV